MPKGGSAIREVGSVELRTVDNEQVTKKPCGLWREGWGRGQQKNGVIPNRRG